MTERRAPYVAGGPTEAEIQAEVVCRLRGAGWFVTVTAQDRSTRRQVAGLPDLIAVRGDRALFVECKRPGGRLRASQRRFLDEIRPHCGDHVQYAVMWQPAHVEAWVSWGEGDA